MAIVEETGLRRKKVCMDCGEAVAEVVRLRVRWYTGVAALGGFWGWHALGMIVSTATLFLEHVHTCSKCNSPLFRGSYFSLLREKRAISTLPLLYPFYALPFYLCLLLILSDFQLYPPWSQYQQYCASKPVSFDCKTAFQTETVYWRGKKLCRMGGFYRFTPLFD